MILRVDIEDEADRWLGQMALEAGITRAEMAEIGVYNIIACYLQARQDQNVLAATSLVESLAGDGPMLSGKSDSGGTG